LSYNIWVKKHAAVHKTIIAKLIKQGLSKEQIIDYFDFENMKEKERDFCPLYAKNKKCHEMQELNCYLCACPNFRFNDAGFKNVDGKTEFSYCSIASKDGKQGIYGDAIHQDCSQCSVPHHRSYVEKHFHLEWAEIMKVCKS